MLLTPYRAETAIEWIKFTYMIGFLAVLSTAYVLVHLYLCASTPAPMC